MSAGYVVRGPFGYSRIRPLDAPFSEPTRPVSFLMLRVFTRTKQPTAAFKLNRGELASMLWQCRRANLNPHVCGRDDGVMKECPTTTLPLWSRIH